MDGAETIEVEVAYALPEEQELVALEVPAGTTVEEAIRLSGILDRHPEIDLQVNKVGIFGKVTRPSTVLRPGDRVEIYRPLKADPKEVRRRRTAKGKEAGSR